MDKFKLLEKKLEDIIIKLNKEIEAKQKELSIKRAIYEEKDKGKEEIANELQNSKNDLEFLKIFENKNVFITAIKECNKSVGKNIKQAEKFEKFITALLLLFLLVASIALPLFGVTILSVIALLETLFACLVNHEVKKIRKKASIEKLESEIKKYEEFLSKREDQKNKEDEELANIIFELDSLSNERDEYLKKLKKVQEVRNAALEQVAKVAVLNEMYDKSEIEQSLNIRVREKKEKDKI